MNVFVKFDEIPSMILQDIKETKRYGHTFVRSFVHSDGQRENSIPSHKQFAGGIITLACHYCCLKLDPGNGMGQPLRGPFFSLVSSLQSFSSMTL